MNTYLCETEHIDFTNPHIMEKVKELREHSTDTLDYIRQVYLFVRDEILNTQVWKEWYPNEGQKYTGNGNAMLEVYSPGDMKSPDYECGIWVPICRPEEQEEYETAEIVSTMMVTGIL